MESLKILAMRELIKNVIHEEGYEIIEKSNWSQSKRSPCS